MPGRHVLVVDDDPLVLESLELLVGHIGHQVDVATSGMEALRKLDSSRFDVVLTDSKMPGMDGYTFAREARKRHPSLPIILMSGSTSRRTSPDITCWMHKPFSLEDLTTAITQVADRRSPE